MLEAIKSLAGLNPRERRQKQRGRFDMKWEEAKLKAMVEVASQGVATGEQVQIKFQRAAGKPRTLVELGVRAEKAEQARLLMNAPGWVIISAPPQGGLTTIWQSALITSDRMTRDCVAFLREDERDTDLENIQPNRIREGQEPAELLRKVLLTQPNVLIAPDLISPAFADRLVSEALEEERTVLTRTPASSSAEAILAVLPKVGDRARFASALKGVVNQRLVRRLCPKCRVEMPVKPDVITKLGGNPASQKTLFRHYQLPPVEQRVDEKGNPVEMTPCEHCQGTGFRERIAALEVVPVDDGIRRLLTGKPDAASLEKAFRAAGVSSLVDEAYRLILAGETSMDEVRRVFRPPASG